MSTGYLYDTAERLQTRKPYSFAAVASRDHAAEWLRARASLTESLGVSPEAVRPYVPASRFRLDDPDPLQVSRDLAGLRSRWEDSPEHRTIPLAEFLEEFVQTLRPAPAALLVQAAAPRWAASILQTLLGRFESYGCIHAEYDRDWRRTRSNPNPPAGVVRLALLGAWVAWVNNPLDRPRALAALNATMKIVDLCSSGVRHHAWELEGESPAQLAAAIRVEAVLVAGWQSRVSLGVPS